MYQFKFSIVMAVYNVELFLAEAIESVLKQDIGFKENVQLILVNDGSKDSSGKICDEYASQYPQNILVIHKENGGVSTARNEGLKYIQGKYVNFLDSDDKLSANTLSRVYKFFEDHYEETDVISIPIIFFDGQKGSHILNYKFQKGNRVINLKEEYDCIQLSFASAFTKATVAENIMFDSRLKYAEDAKELIKILAEKCTLGVVADASYYYRKRSTGELSAIQSGVLNKAYYMPYLNYFTYSSLKKMQEVYGQIPLFVQFTLMYDLQWRFRINAKEIKNVLNFDEYKEFEQKIFGALNYFNDQIILEQKNIGSELKGYLLSKKHSTDISMSKDTDYDLAYFVKDTEVVKLKVCPVKLEFLKLKEDRFTVEFTCTYLGEIRSSNANLYLKTSNGLVECKTNGRILHSKCFDDIISTQITYVAILDKFENDKIKIYESFDDACHEKENVITGKFFPVVNEFANNYAVIGKYMVTIQNNAIVIQLANLYKTIVSEVKLLNEYVHLNTPAAKKAAISRCLYHLVKPFFRKEVWLISDRINKADDNGEAFFKYINEKKLPVNSYFVIRKDSADYSVVAKIGKVLDYSTLKHKFYHLLADKTISAAADDFVYNPFGGNEKYYRDILSMKKHIFLQHGIHQSDLSHWLNRYNKNLSIFVTAAFSEFNYIVNGNYFYNDSVVKLTGLARYDRLVKVSEKYISIMPTWRNSLGNNSTYFNDGIKRYDDSIKKTRYFEFYNTLLNHKKLLSYAKEKGYIIRFMPHPNIIPFIKLFDKCAEVEFCDIRTSYRDIFATSGLIVTDYSSVAFDFAYLRKPVIYAQFDKEEVFSGAHIYTQGDYNYEKDGFGEVEYDLDATVDRIIEYMQSDCKLKDKYRERIDRFFAFNDRNNCQRVYEAIKSLD